MSRNRVRTLHQLPPNSEDSARLGRHDVEEIVALYLHIKESYLHIIIHHGQNAKCSALCPDRLHIACSQYQVNAITLDDIYQESEPGPSKFDPIEFEAWKTLHPGKPSTDVEALPVMGPGTGFVIHPSGYIVTAAHVVSGACSLIVRIDKTEYQAHCG